MNGRANVVSETGKRQLRRARSAPHRVSRFEDANGASGAGHFNTRGKTVRARPDDDCVKLHRRIVYAAPVITTMGVTGHTRIWAIRFPGRCRGGLLTADISKLLT